MGTAECFNCLECFSEWPILKDLRYLIITDNDEFIKL